MYCWDFVTGDFLHERKCRVLTSVFKAGNNWEKFQVPLSLATLMAMTVLMSIVASAMPRSQIPVIGGYI